MERKWYKYNKTVQLNGEDECSIDYSNYYYYLSEEEKEKFTKKREFWNFEYAKECAQEENMEYYMVYKPKTWYRRKEKIGFRLAEWWDDCNGHKWLTKEEFKSYIIHDKFTLLNIQHYSLDELMQHSSVEDFMNYMKDNGMTTCPMIK